LKNVRTRHQDGWIEKTAAGTWKAHWYEYVKDAQTGEERRRHRSRIVGVVAKAGKQPKTDRSISSSERPLLKFEAEAELQKIIAPLNATQSSRRDDRVPLSWFVEYRWRPTMEGNWGATTKKTNGYFIRAIVHRFGDTPLCELDSVQLQDWLNKMAIDYSRSMVFHCHTYLKSICAEAVDQDFLAKDPARKLKRPKTAKPDEAVLKWGHCQSVIDAAETLRDKLAIKVASGTAVRPGELFAFRWRSFEELPSGRHALKVTETVYKCQLRSWAKTEGSEDYVPVPNRLAIELQEWRKISAHAGSDDFIFPNSKGGFVDYENFSARVLEPIREKLGLSKLNFQMLRRSYATLAVGERKGTLKDVQKQLRHARPDTTLENYVKEIPESVYAMADSMYERIAGRTRRKS
jgi:integrase